MARHRPSSKPPGSANVSQREDRLLARKDALNAFVIWISLEGLNLLLNVLVPNPVMAERGRLTAWIGLSVLMGLFGSLLVGASSLLLKNIQEQVDRAHPNKRAMLISAQAVGWAGLVGISFPILMVGATLWSYLLKGT
jgi:hypothetical protein